MYNLAEIVGPWLYVAPTKRWRHHRWKFGQKISPAPPRPAEKKTAPPRPAPPASKNTLKFSFGAPRRKTFPYLRKSAGRAGRVLKWPRPAPRVLGFYFHPWRHTPMQICTDHCFIWHEGCKLKLALYMPWFILVWCKEDRAFNQKGF